eukprot:scaffold2058_cov69-Phaeocystis_antarctica.AAC.3
MYTVYMGLYRHFSLSGPSVALRASSAAQRTEALGENPSTRRRRGRARALWHCRADHSWRHGRKTAAGTPSAARKKARSQSDERKGWGWGWGSGFGIRGSVGVCVELRLEWELLDSHLRLVLFTDARIGLEPLAAEALHQQC